MLIERERERREEKERKRKRKRKKEKKCCWGRIVCTFIFKTLFIILHTYNLNFDNFNEQNF